MEIEVEVTTEHYNANGELIDAIASGAKLTKADAGRSVAADEDVLIIKHNPNESTKAQIDYNGTTNSTGEEVSMNTTVELNVKGQVMDLTRGELIDAIASGAKLTKADAGRMANENSETWLNLQVNEGADGRAPEITTRSNSKTTRAEPDNA